MQIWAGVLTNSRAANFGPPPRLSGRAIIAEHMAARAAQLAAYGFEMVTMAG